MKVLITGGAGFIGKALRSFYQNQGAQVVWTTRRPTDQQTPQDSGQIFLDLKDLTDLDSLIQRVRPDLVLHLAAQSSVKDSFQQWSETLQINFLGSFGLFEAIRRFNPQTRVISVGSSAEYGSLSREHLHLSESLLPKPSSPYALSKWTQAQAVEYFGRIYQMPMIHIRPFAVIGPEKRGDFISDLLWQMVEIRNGQLKELKLGDIQRERDFIDIEDFCRALDLIQAKGKPGEIYNVANGEAISLTRVIQTAADLLKISVQAPALDPSQIRKSDDYRLVADIQKLKLLGYQQSISLEGALQKIIDGF